MADGLAGHEHDFYYYVANSSWTGGHHEYSGLNEGFPYWFNGIVPLAYGLNNTRLKRQIQEVVNGPQGVVTRQHHDGWIGPERGRARNFWARYPMFLGFIQLLEADSSYRPTVLPAMHKFSGLMNTMLKDNGSGYTRRPGDYLSPEDHAWGRVRVSDMMISLQWLYENDPRNRSPILLDNMEMLRQGQLDWAYWYQEGVYISKDLATIDPAVTWKHYHYEHGVNVAQGLKAGAVINRFTRNSSLVDLARRAVNWTNTYHGAPTGSILGDERMEGLGPYYASETCTAVELIYSLAYLYQAIGDNSFADQAEKVAFNALPVHFTPDWWAHNYGSQPNGPDASRLRGNPFYNFNNLALTYGLEPDYPCCTVNHGQGYPKFLAASFVRVGNNGLAHVLLSPGSVATTLADGNAVTVSCETQYPFDSALQYTVEASSTFDFHVRVPSWASSSAASITLAGTASPLSPNPHSGLHTLSLRPGRTTFTVHLWPTNPPSPGSPPLTLEHRANDSVAITAGPLLYSLHIGATIKSYPPLSSNQRPLPPGYAPPQSRDYSMTNSTPWAIAIDTSTLVFRRRSDVSAGSALPNPIWAPGAPPTWIEARGCEIEWPLWKGVPGPVPRASERRCVSAARNVTLVPFGSAKLHMSELPTVNLGEVD